MHSIILTVHNKDWLIDSVVNGIIENTTGEYELIITFDGCTDNSESVVYDCFNGKDKLFIPGHTPNVFETAANNYGALKAVGEYVIIVQDDMIIKEYGWNERMEKPFNAFDDVFAVTARTAHNWKINTNSKHLNMEENLNDCWCDICLHTDHADRTNTPRDEFAVRASVNRGPLMINHDDFYTLGYFDMNFCPQDMDDHDLMYRMHTELGKVCGCYWIDFESKDEWGGTRASGSPAPWLYEANHKNMKIFYERHKDSIEQNYKNENRKLPE